MSEETYNPLDSSQWKMRFKKKEEQWKDMQRAGRMIIISVVLTLVTVLYILFYISYKTDWISTASESREAYLRFLVIFFSILLAPVLITILSFIASFRTGNSLIQTLYKPPEDINIRKRLSLRLFGIPLLPSPLNMIFKYPFITLKSTEDLPPDHWARWLGGPATLVIYDGVAVYLERGNQFSRVLGPGLPMPMLERYERIKEIVDLRPQVKTAQLKPWTKDGIQVTLSIRAEIQIGCSDEAKKSSVRLHNDATSTHLRFPFDAKKVKTAIERIAVKYSDTNKSLFETSWDEAAMGSIKGKINSYITAHSVDELFFKGEPIKGDFLPENDKPLRITSFDVSENLFIEINEKLTEAGSQLLNLQITDFTPVSTTVSEELIRYWKANREKMDAIRNSETEAESIRANNKARASAQKLLLDTLIENLEYLNKGTGDIEATRLVEASTLFLTQTLEQTLGDPLIGSYLAKETLDTIKMLREELKL